MNMKVAAGVALALPALVPGIGSATMVLDTGTPTGNGVLLNTTGWYAAEFSLSAGQTVTQLSAYLNQGAGGVGSTFTWDIYSAAGTFLGPNRESPSFSTTGTFTGNGWNTTNVSWAPTTP